MSTDPAIPYVTLLACGLGLLVAGAGNAALPSSRRWIRAFILALGAGVTFVISGSAWAAVAVGVVAGGCALLTRAAGPSKAASRIPALTGLLQRSWFRWGVVGVAGCGLAAFGAERVLQAGAVGEFRPTDWQEAIGAMPDVVEAEDVAVKTDGGIPIRLMRPKDPRTPVRLFELQDKVLRKDFQRGRISRSGPADLQSNCFGWVFTGGRYWLFDEEVEQILKENGYGPVTAAAVGDVAIYRDVNDVISHVAIVRAVRDDGTVLVEGKIGWMGVFVHRVQDSDYGQRYTFYRSPRRGHLLQGFGGDPPGGETVRPTSE
jgi:hypothetical protein